MNTPKTYREKLIELRLKSLEIIEDALNSDSEFVRFLNAIYLTNAMPDDVLDSTMPQTTGKAKDNELPSGNRKRIFTPSRSPHETLADRLELG